MSKKSLIQPQERALFVSKEYPQATVRVKEFAEKNSINIFLELPNGWVKDYGATTAPKGSVWINNGKSRFSGEREQGLLIEEVD